MDGAEIVCQGIGSEQPMRPVNKGSSPYTSITNYKQAMPYLENAIGSYCSYCGMKLDNAPEVEHVASKSTDPNLITQWDNLLLACKACNTRKSNTVTAINKSEYLWPDEDNTALAFRYPLGIPQVDSAMLNAVDPTGESAQKATNLFNLLKLGPQPQLKTDRRVLKRNEAYQTAKDSLEDWKIDKTPTMKRQIIRTAVANGFFSIWMTVFEDEPEILHELISAFPGTEQGFFDAEGHPKMLMNIPAPALTP